MIPDAPPRRETGRIGEIIEAASTHFIAECPPALLNTPPVLGSLVKVPPADAVRATAEQAESDPFADRPANHLPIETADGTIYAIVTGAATDAGDRSRRASAYGLTEDELRREQPQIFSILTTEFSAWHVGQAEQQLFRNGFPRRPPRLHAFAFACTIEEICVVTTSRGFLRSLSAAGGAEADELIVACIREAWLCHDRDYGFLVAAGRELSRMMRDEPLRLTALLARLEP